MFSQNQSREKSPQALLIITIREQLKLPYSESLLENIESNYKTLNEMIEEKLAAQISEKPSNDSQKTRNYKHAYRHLLIHFHNDIVNFLLSHLSQHQHDLIAQNFLQNIIEINMEFAPCQHNPIRKLREDLLKGSSFPPSLDFYQNQHQGVNLTEKDNLSQKKLLLYPAKKNNLWSYLYFLTPSHKKTLQNISDIESGEKEGLSSSIRPSNYGSLSIN